VTLSGVPRYDTLRIRGIIQGQWEITLIDGGATHNFIDASLVLRWALQTEEFEGFDVAVADGHTVECLDRVPGLEIKLGNYTVRDTFYVVDLSDTYVVLGVQWLIILGKITTNYQTLEMGFKDSDGKRVVLRGISTGAPKTVSSKEDGEALQAWGGNIFHRVLDHYAEGFRGSTAISDRDQELVGTTSIGFWFDSIRETTRQGI
jgi:hypothetical protein